MCGGDKRRNDRSPVDYLAVSIGTRGQTDLGMTREDEAMRPFDEARHLHAVRREVNAGKRESEIARRGEGGAQTFTKNKRHTQSIARIGFSRSLMCTRTGRHIPIRGKKGERITDTHCEKHPITFETAYRTRFKIRHECELSTDEGRRPGLRHIRRDAGDDLTRSTLFVNIN